MVGRVHQINVSGGGVPKRPVPEALVSAQGVAGDAQADRVHHGGPERAVCLWSLEVLRALQAEGHPIEAGGAGENLTVAGLAWERVMPGSRLRVGERVLLEVTRYTSPCKTIAPSFSGGRFARISQDRHPGQSRVYARVLVEGLVRAGDPVALLPAPPP